MYNCQDCKQTSLPNEKLHKVVIITRPKTYYEHWIEYNRAGEEIPRRREVNTGVETVKEKLVCTACEAKVNAG